MTGFHVHHRLPKLAQTHLHGVDDAIQTTHPLLSPSPPAFNLSQHQGLFWWLSSLHQVAKVLEFQLQHQSFQWIFRTDFLYNGLVGSPCSPGTLNSLLQHHRSKASILQCSAFFIVQLPDLYMTTAKIIALTRQNFVGNVMLQHSKNEDHGIQSHHFMANRWGYNGNSERLFSLAPKSLQMVIAAMKLKDTCSLEEKLWPT